jgi:chromosome segregation ATPase
MNRDSMRLEVNPDDEWRTPSKLGRSKGKRAASEYNNVNGHSIRDDQNTTHVDAQPNVDLDPFTETTKDTLRSMLAAQQAINNLTDLYNSKVKSIEQIPRIHQLYEKLEKQSRYKDEKIKYQQSAIKALSNLSRDHELKTAEETQQLANKKQALEEREAQAVKNEETAAKKLRAQEAELKNQQEKEHKKLNAQLEKQFEDHKNDLEQEFQKREKDNEKRLADLVANNQKLKEKIQESKNQNEERAELLKKAKEDFDEMTRVKDSFKDDARRLETKLKMMENEFALNAQTTEF